MFFFSNIFCHFLTERWRKYQFEIFISLWKITQLKNLDMHLKAFEPWMFSSLMNFQNDPCFRKLWTKVCFQGFENLLKWIFGIIRSTSKTFDIKVTNILVYLTAYLIPCVTPLKEVTSVYSEDHADHRIRPTTLFSRLKARGPNIVWLEIRSAKGAHSVE